MSEDVTPIFNRYLPLSGGTMTGDINIGSNKIVTTNLSIVERDAATLQVRNAANTTDKGIRADIFTVVSYVRLAIDGVNIQTRGADDDNALFEARDNGVGLVEVARLQGAADPYMQFTLPPVFLPIATASLPATPVEGMVAYDATLNKLVVYTGAGWETVTSV